MTKNGNSMEAGRLQNDVSLDEILTDYTRRIFDLISLLKFKLVVFDFDGTLTDFKYADKTLLPCRDDELQEYCKTHNLYENVRLLKTMQYVINELDLNDVFVVTSTVPSLRKNKNKVLAQLNINPEHIIHTNGSAEKINVLKELHAKTGRDIIFVEDLYKTLLTAEETLDFVQGYHISSLIA